MTDHQHGSLVRSTSRLGRGVRDGWLIVGVALLLTIVAEAAFRSLRVIRHVVVAVTTAGTEPPSPFDATDWAADYWIGHEKEEAVRWTPYVNIRNPTFKAPYAEVDTVGHRVTPVPPSTATRPFHVFFLGGSTTFGWFQRAEHTLPAEAASRIQAFLGEAARLEVTNFGAPGHTFTQEVFELILQLRSGARPDIVVFYDGIND